MNILLIRPKPDKETIGLQSVMICEPLELMTLASVLKNNNHNVEIIDMILEKEKLPDIVIKYKPDIIGITGYISHVNVIKNYAFQIKSINKNIKILVGGVHAEVCPEDFADKNIDAVCRSAEDFYSEAGCKDLSKLLPIRDLPDKYRKKYYYLFQENCALIKTSFGCPYNCKFCFCKEISDYSTRNIDDVIEELKSIEQKEVYIVDDDFLFNRDRLLEFAEKIKLNNIRKNFLVYGRADFISNNEDIIKILKDVGLGAVIVGLEAAKQEELDSYNKKTKIDDNINAVKILKKYDIECYGTVILGIDWDKKDFKNLYSFLKAIDIVFVNLQPFTPMPHTPYFEEHKNNLLIPYCQHEKWDMAHLVVKPSKISVRNYYWQIIKLYYMITVTPKHTAYMIKKYGLTITLKLSLGAMEVTWQYIKKMLRG